jgi:DNA-binding PadR family transcriptional regulator
MFHGNVLEGYVKMPKTDQLTPLSAAILFALAGGASHGYAMIKDIEESTNGEMRPRTGSMYLALHRLVEGGLIEETSGRGDDERRRYYRLTPDGRTAARGEAERMANLVRMATAKKLIPATRR